MRKDEEVLNMPFCRKCGAPLDENSKFCNSCGQPVQPLAGTTQPDEGNMKTSQDFTRLFDTIIARGIPLFESGPFRFIAALKPNPVVRGSKAELTFLCKNVEDKNVTAEIYFHIPRKKGLSVETSDKDKVIYKSDFTPNEVKGWILPMACASDGHPGKCPIEIYVYSRHRAGYYRKGVALDAGIA